ncbi:MAG: hypothetical protein ACRC0X_04485 [Brevinema sp.]
MTPPNTNSSQKSWHEPLFMPSFHMIRDPNTKNPASQSLDIKRTNKGEASIKDTAQKVYEEYKKVYRGHDDNAHYHLGI